jgi:hypothetical protein
MFQKNSWKHILIYSSYLVVIFFIKGLIIATWSKIRQINRTLILVDNQVLTVKYPQVLLIFRFVI